MPDQSFPKTHRLKRQRLIRPLFDRRREDVSTLAVGCVRLLWRTAAAEEVGTDVPLQVGFAPGRTRTAVRRNRIRRLLRETYRTHQYLLADALRKRAGVLTLMMLYRADPDAADTAIPRDVPRALRQLADHLRTDDAPERPHQETQI